MNDPDSPQPPSPSSEDHSTHVEAVEHDEAEDHSKSIQRPPPPRLRIHHVFLLTVVVALLASMLRAFPGWSELGETQEMVWKTYQAIVAILIATGVTITGLGVWWRWRGFAYWDQPGQYIALFYAIWVISYLTALWEVVVFGDAPYRNTVAIQTCLALFRLPVEIYVVWKVADSVPWRVFFGLGVLTSVLQCLGAWQTWWSTALFLTVLGWAILSDIRRGVPRHWSHWCGAALTACNGILRVSVTLLIQSGFFETTS
ncbi:hypothetical protein [Aeoliella sp.]|uniref:hypothetical protein n=1 Tax=Aeoliella sp. TaxID=2795800 RepID=UPI003CCC081A